jgi:hypothetical protein
MRGFSRHDVDLIKTVQAHIRNLVSLSGHDADEPTVRVATGALRALISEEMLQHAWSASGLRGPMTFKTYFIGRSAADAVAYCGGGDILPNIPFSVCRNAELEERVLNLEDFCRQTRILIGREAASTTDIIKYMANALGGSHFDPAGKTARRYDLLRRVEAGRLGRSFFKSTIATLSITKFYPLRKLLSAHLRSKSFWNGPRQIQQKARAEGRYADSDDLTRVYRFDLAQDSDLMSSGTLSILALWFLASAKPRGQS